MQKERSPGPLRPDPIDRPQSLAAIVAEKLKQAILRREVALGEALSEEKIAAAMDVSRTPVREALTILQMQGLITILPRRGSFVFKPDAEELHLLVDYRLNMELLASRLAMERDPEGTLKGLRAAIATMRIAREADDATAYAEADTVFHNTFFEYCGNRFFQEAFDIAAGRVAVLRMHQSAYLKLHLATTFQEHVDIAGAIEVRDPAHLASLMQNHIGAMEQNYADVLSRSPGS
jgi:DNA-binding GntR family transcriptional regulator